MINKLIIKFLDILCSAGKRQYQDTCIPCKKGTYNHGSMPKDRTFCYNIIPDSEFSYLNITNVQCSPGYIGIPEYEDGEYETGCIIDNSPPTFQPLFNPHTCPNFSTLFNPHTCPNFSTFFCSNFSTFFNPHTCPNFSTFFCSNDWPNFSTFFCSNDWSITTKDN